MHSLRWAWSYIREYKGRFALGLLLVLVVSALNMLNPYIAGKIVDDVIYGQQKNVLGPLLGIMIGFTFFRTIVRYGYQMTFEKLSQNVIFKMRANLYDRLHKLDFSFYDQTKTGDIMARMTGDLEAVRHFTAWSIYMIFENAMILLFAIGFMFYIHPPLALAMLMVTPFIGFFAFRLTADVRPTFTEIRNQFARLNSVVQENISGNRVVKAFAKEEYEIQKFSAENGAFKEKNLQSAKIWEKYLPILDSLAGVLTVVMILAGGIMVIHGSLTFGELVMFNSLIWALNNPMRMAGWLINDVQRFIASAEKVEELLKTEPKIMNQETEAAKVKNFNGVVEFDHVNFSYGEGPVLKDINFKAKPGQSVAIIGPTGSGKSTLVNLLSRFYDASSGVVRVDGINVKDWDIQRLRDGMAMVMQDIFLFSDTIEGNIAYGSPQSSLDSIQNAARLAEAHDFISALPEGYDTIVGERGVGLSGGQRQRIALARAILKDPSILILDDTTSSVDMETELRIQTTLQSIHQCKTRFIVAHRISSVKEADLILVMENGRIIERGKHTELIKKKGYYYNVYKNQYGNFDHKQHGKEVI
ncbi:ATP-binding cassette subfamily B protein [Peribacillus deserti]|uniref:ATP-binding cassette subfamily B protein n=1 Tax=Peribacillus deserti TaxID=673318 RepID=A0ABS2QFW7_9BACI|nr:ABC transporter ATP-binding protein [Peribacillus deserti]MBM7692058.1 ATP-binding cassette subfamily B protein [Peribacillus deserti]